MIISIEKARQLVNLDDWTDEKIRMKLKSIEQTIRKYTNNNFQDRAFRRVANIEGNLFVCENSHLFEVGDTVQVSESELNKGLFVIETISNCNFTVEESVKDEQKVLVTKISYPDDVVDCCLNLLEWEIKHRGKVGIQSETLSRHSVTYFNQDNGNQVMGYPASLLGCLKAYRKPRF